MSENRVVVTTEQLPEIATVGLINKTEPWLHLDRTLDINTMIFVLEGTVYVSEDGTDYEVHKHQVFFLKNGLHHYGVRLTQPGTKWYWVSFRPAKVDTIVESTDRKTELLYVPKLLTVAKPNQFRTLIASMEKLYRSNQPYKFQKLSGIFFQVLFTLLGQPDTPHSSKDIQMVAPRVIELLEAQIDKKFKASLIEEALNLNYSYIGRLFKAETGLTINRYYMELKVQKVITYLQTTNLTLLEICDELSYPNPYYLSRTFKKVTGLSPRDYKNQLYR